MVCTDCTDFMKFHEDQLSACEIKDKICYPQTDIVCVESLISHCKGMYKGIHDRTDDPKSHFVIYINKVEILRTALKMCEFAPEEEFYTEEINAFLNKTPTAINMLSGNPGNLILWKYNPSNIDTFIRESKCKYIQRMIVDSEGDISIDKLIDWCKSLELEFLNTTGYIHEKHEREKWNVAMFVSQKSSDKMKEDLGGILYFLEQKAEKM